MTGLHASSDVWNVRWILPVSRPARKQHVLRRKSGHDRKTGGRTSCSLPRFSMGLLWQAWLQVSADHGIFYLDNDPAIKFRVQRIFTVRWCRQPVLVPLSNLFYYAAVYSSTATSPIYIYCHNHYIFFLRLKVFEKLVHEILGFRANRNVYLGLLENEAIWHHNSEKHTQNSTETL